MEPSKVTINEVAKKANVSAATVSRFLTNPEAIKEANRKRIEEAIKELHYEPSIYARCLAGGKAGGYGLIIPGYEGIFYSFYAIELIRAVAARLDERKLDLHLHVYWNKDIFQTAFVDGVIFADIIGNEEQLKRISAAGIPCTVINRKIEDVNINCVSIDNFKGAYDATEFLLHHGHKKIVHLAGDLQVECARQRVEGFKKALEANNIEFKDDYVKITNFSRREARKIIEEIFASSKSKPTGFFCCSDEVAVEVLHFCAEKGIAIPKEVSVIGFDDNQFCMYGDLALTTVRQPLDRMAALGVDVLKDSIDKKALPQKIILPTELVIRDTVDFI